MVNVFELLIVKQHVIHKLNNFRHVVVHVEKPSVPELNKLNPNDTILIFTTGLVIHFTTVQIFCQIVRQFVNGDANVVMDIVEITKENVSKLINANCHHVHPMNFVNV